MLAHSTCAASEINVAPPTGLYPREIPGVQQQLTQKLHAKSGCPRAPRQAVLVLTQLTSAAPAGVRCMCSPRDISTPWTTYDPLLQPCVLPKQYFVREILSTLNLETTLSKVSPALSDWSWAPHHRTYIVIAPALLRSHEQCARSCHSQSCGKLAGGLGSAAQACPWSTMARHSRRDRPNQTCLPMWLAHPRALQLLGSRCAACPCCQTAGAWQSSLAHASGEKPPAWGEAHPKSRRTLMLLGQGSYGREKNSPCDFDLYWAC